MNNTPLLPIELLSELFAFLNGTKLTISKNKDNLILALCNKTLYSAYQTYRKGIVDSLAFKSLNINFVKLIIPENLKDIVIQKSFKELTPIKIEYDLFEVNIPRIILKSFTNLESLTLKDYDDRILPYFSVVPRKLAFDNSNVVKNMINQQRCMLDFDFPEILKLCNIRELVINTFTIFNTSLVKMKNLEKLELFDSVIYDSDNSVLKNLRTVTCTKSEITELKLFENVETLTMINSKGFYYNLKKLKNVKHLELINCPYLDIRNVKIQLEFLPKIETVRFIDNNEKETIIDAAKLRRDAEIEKAIIAAKLKEAEEKEEAEKALYSR